MSMEPSVNSMGGGVALLLFKAEGPVLSANFEPCRGAGGSDTDEPREELGPD